MRSAKRIISTVLALSLVVSMPVSASAAKKQPKLNKTKLTLKVGKSTKLKVKNTKKKVKWSSSKKKVATVKNGKVTAKKVGKTTITAKVGKKKLKCKVTVTKNTSTNKSNTNSNAKPTSTPAPAQVAVSIASVKVVNATTIHVTLSAEQELSKDKFTVKIKKYASGTYNRELTLESVTTTDKKTYVIKVDVNDLTISLNRYVQVTVNGLTGMGTASMDTVYEEVSEFTDSYTYISSVGAEVEQKIYMDDTYGYVTVESVELPAGLSYTFAEREQYITVKGSIQQTGINEMTLRYVDELGNKYVTTRRWLAGDSNTIVTYCESSYGTAEAGNMTECYGSLYVAGGSGEYSCKVADYDSASSVRVSVNEDEAGYGYVYGVFAPGTANVKIEVTDAYDFGIMAANVWTVDVKPAKRLYVKFKDAKGNDLNASVFSSMYGYAYNTNEQDKYCYSARTMIDETGQYFVLPDGRYNVCCYAGGLSKYLYDFSVSGTDNMLEVNFPVYPVTLTSDELDLSNVEWTYVNAEEDEPYSVGRGEMVYVRANEKICGSISINNVYYEMEAIYTDTNCSTLAVTVTNRINQDGGTITTDQPIDATLAGAQIYYRFVPETTGVYCFYSESNADTIGYLLDESKEMITSNDDSGEESNFRIVSDLEADKTYYIAMRSFGNYYVGKPAKLIVREATAEELEEYEDNDESFE